MSSVSPAELQDALLGGRWSVVEEYPDGRYRIPVEWEDNQSRRLAPR